MAIKPYIQSLRKVRVWHRFLGTSLALLLVISAITGILLSLKKDVKLIQPPTQKGISKNLSEWKPIEEIAQIAQAEFLKAHPDQVGNQIDRLDVRPSKGIVKVLFEKGYWELQIDATTGEVKSIARRHSDWIEALHDGSIISDLFKLITMNILGIGLLIMICSGLWLWYGPKKYREWKKNNAEEQLLKTTPEEETKPK